VQNDVGPAGCGQVFQGKMCSKKNSTGGFTLALNQKISACQAGTNMFFYLSKFNTHCNTSDGTVIVQPPSGNAGTFTKGHFNCGAPPPGVNAQWGAGVTVTGTNIADIDTPKSKHGDPRWIVVVGKKTVVVKVDQGCLKVTGSAKTVTQDVCPLQQTTVSGGTAQQAAPIQLTPSDLRGEKALQKVLPNFQIVRPTTFSSRLTQVFKRGTIVVGLDERACVPSTRTSGFIQKYLAALARLWKVRLQLLRPLEGTSELGDGTVDFIVSTAPPKPGIPLVSGGTCGVWQLDALDPKLQVALETFATEMIEQGLYALLYQSAFSAPVVYDPVLPVVFTPQHVPVPPAGKVASSITLTSSRASPVLLGSDPYRPSATASSGLPVTITLDSSSSTGCTFGDGTLSFHGTGTCVVDFDQAGDSHWAAAPRQQQTIAVIDPSSAHIYWTNEVSGAIGQADTSGANPKDMFIAGPKFDLGLTVDGGQIYWSYHQPGGIGRAFLDNPSQAEQSLIPAGVQSPIGVAVDGPYVYWADYAADTIGRADLDGTHVVPNFITLAKGSGPFGLAIWNGSIYWTNAIAGSIGTAPLDNPANVTQSFIPNCAQPEGVAVDGNYIFWTNSATGMIGGAPLHDPGNANQSFIPGGKKPIGIAVAGGYVYWADWALGTIDRYLVYPPVAAAVAFEPTVQVLVKGLSEPYGLAVGE
jgi:hypothetical protein